MQNNKKRVIIAHKGGRSDLIKMLLTPKEKDLIKMSKGDMSYADYYLHLIKMSKEVNRNYVTYLRIYTQQKAPTKGLANIKEAIK
jgi:hypothetical protein